MLLRESCRANLAMDSDDDFYSAVVAYKDCLGVVTIYKVEDFAKEKA